MKEYGKIKCNECSYTAYTLSSRWLCPSCDIAADIEQEKEKQSYYLSELEKARSTGLFSVLENLNTTDLDLFISDSLAARIIESKQKQALSFLQKLEGGKDYVSENGQLRRFDDEFVLKKLKIAEPVERYSYYLSKKNLPISMFSNIMRWYSFFKKELKHEYSLLNDR